MPSNPGSPSRTSSSHSNPRHPDVGRQSTSGSIFGSPSSSSSTISSNPIRMPLRTVPTPSALGTPKKRFVIRADPTMISTFDPADKELYDLWCPK